MAERITVAESTGTHPYRNLAEEELLCRGCREGEVILYLWQNRNTVVVGRSQNAWKECRVQQLEAEGGFLARRLSGGGAVYHDLGNLNFSFLARKEDYSVERQLEVIQRALALLGVRTEKSGRNDVLAEGRKVSGNAFYRKKDRCCHHGTLLVQVDVEKLSRYLVPSREKLQAKGVDSVSSRVGNLADLAPGLTVGRLREALREAAGQVYGVPASPLESGRLDPAEMETLSRQYASPDWRYGKSLDFQQALSRRFPWGELEIQLRIQAGKIGEAAVYSDAMDAEWIQRLPRYLEGLEYRRSQVCGGLAACPAEDARQEAMRQDILAWLADGEEGGNHHGDTF